MHLKKTRVRFHAGIVVGRFYSNFREIEELVKMDKRFSIINNNKNLVSLMSHYKIGIFTFGITTFEAFFVGMPSINISHSFENDRYAKKIAKYDCMNYLGHYKRIDFGSLPEEIFKLMNDSKLCLKYTKNARNMIDGKGIQRVAMKIVELSN